MFGGGPKSELELYLDRMVVISAVRRPEGLWYPFVIYGIFFTSQTWFRDISLGIGLAFIPLLYYIDWRRFGGWDQELRKRMMTQERAPKRVLNELKHGHLDDKFGPEALAILQACAGIAVATFDGPRRGYVPTQEILADRELVKTPIAESDELMKSVVHQVYFWLIHDVRPDENDLAVLRGIRESLQPLLEQATALRANVEPDSGRRSRVHA